MVSDRETDSGYYAKRTEDGQYIEEKFGFGWALIHPDGHTITNLRNGNTYDLEQIGGGSVTVEDDGTEVVIEADVINLGGGHFAVTEPSTGEVKAVIDSGAIGTDELAADSVTSTELADDSVVNAAIAVAAVNTPQIDTGAVTNSEVAPATLTSAEIDETDTFSWTSEHQFDAGITGLPEPTASDDAVRKQYADALEQGLQLKDPAVAATDGTSVDLSSTTDPNPIDGVTLSDGDRVLLKDQGDGSENGIYNAVTATDPTTWTRTDDADSDAEVEEGITVFIENGTANKHSSWVQTTPTPTLGTDSLNFVVFSRAGEIEAGNSLSKSGQTINYEPSQTPVENLDGVDWRAMLEGNDADKPAAGEAGRYFYATDVNLLYRDDGSTWNVVTGQGTTNNPLPGTTHFESVSADDATIANAPTTDNDALRWQEGTEVGGFTADGADNSTGNSDWGQSAFVNAGTITFDNAFGQTPEVSTSIDSDRGAVNADEYMVDINNRSTTAFDGRFWQMAATDNSGTTDAYAASYTASEGR